MFSMKCVRRSDAFMAGILRFLFSPRSHCHRAWMRSASSTWSGARRKAGARNLNRLSYLPSAPHRRTAGSALEKSSRFYQRISSFINCFSKLVLLAGLVVTRCLAKATADALARALSLERSLAASESVLYVLEQ